MRTTVTLDPDVEKLVRDLMARGRKSFKQALNDAIRLGLAARGGDREPDFVVRARPLGLRRGIDPARLRDVDDEIEIEEYRRKTRILEEASG